MVSSTVGRYTIARTWELTPRMLGSFAAGIGDPNPAYLDDARPGGVIAHPGQVFTFHWNTRFMPGVTFSREENLKGVHAWVDIRYARPMRQGDVITAQGRQIEVRRIAPGMLTVTRIAMTDALGEEVAVMDSGGISRGLWRDVPDERLAEVPPRPEPSAMADEPAWSTTFVIPREAAHLYTECADIYNDIHTERTAALEAGLKDIILQGGATMSIAIREVVNRSLGGDPSGVARVAGQFRAMVIPGEDITVRCTGESETEEGKSIFFECLNQDGAPAIYRGLVVAR